MAKKPQKPVIDSIQQKQQEQEIAKAYEVEANDEAELAFALPEESFDRIARMTRKLLRAPIAIISFISNDVPWIKSCIGTDGYELPKDNGFTAYVTGGDELFHIPDCQDDYRFDDHPWVKGKPDIRFFAGVPLHGVNGDPIGALCVLGPRPRDLVEFDVDQLLDLGKIVESEIRLRDMTARNAHDAMLSRVEDDRQAYDTLTGLWNKRAILDLLRCDLARGLRDQPTTLATISIDFLNSVYDSHGPVGTEALITGIADAIRHCIRDFDIVGRDETSGQFLLILSNCNKKHATTVCERLRKFVHGNPFRSPVGPIRATVSIGIATATTGTLALTPIVDASAIALATASNSSNKCVTEAKEL